MSRRIGLKLSKATKQKMSEARKVYWSNQNNRDRQRERMLGSNNPHFNGGYGRGGIQTWWKQEVIRRDDYTCQKCGLRETLVGFMQADHIQPKGAYPDLEFELDNGQTLCPNCHRKKTIADDQIYHWFSNKYLKSK